MLTRSHLIADHLGWFKELHEGRRNIQDLMSAKGVHVRTGTAFADGNGGQTVEIDTDEKK